MISQREAVFLLTATVQMLEMLAEKDENKETVRHGALIAGQIADRYRSGEVLSELDEIARRCDVLLFKWGN